MYTARRYPIASALAWSFRHWRGPLIWSGIVFALYHFLHLHSIHLPLKTLGVLGTAVAFYLGFKGNAAYGRLWEARKIWGGIVNSSRTWAVHVRDFIRTSNTSDVALDRVHQEMIYRHIAWLGALRTQLRRRKSWEVSGRADQYRKTLGTVDMSADVLRSRIEEFIDEDELDWLMARKNQATQILAKQSERLRELREEDRMDDFRHVELARLVETLYTLQGKAERIKNFPLPRQYSSANWWFVAIFVLALPFAMVPLFAELPGLYSKWLAIPVCTILGWVFLVWDTIIDWSENPFEGLTNDVPIDALARTIEIDMREILGETELPSPATPQRNILM